MRDRTSERGGKLMQTNDFWKGFLKGNLAVRIESESDCNSFLKLCVHQKINWAGGVSPTDFNVWDVKEDDLCIFCEKGMMYQASEADCLRWKKTIIKYVDLKAYLK